MNIHLICTPEYSEPQVKEVQELLSIQGAPLQISVPDFTFDKTQFPFLQKPRRMYWGDGFSYDVSELVYGDGRGKPLTFDQLFALCQHFRGQSNVDPDDFVVLLTGHKNAFNWFSHVDTTRNIFVQTSEWEYYISAAHKYPVAHEVLTNILLYLMNGHDQELLTNDCHIEPKGCIKDFCQNKQQVSLKLRTGDICEECLHSLRSRGVDERIIDQATAIFDDIRSALLYSKGSKKDVKPAKVHIDSKGKIKIGNTLLNLTPIESTLFIFFISQNIAASLNDLAGYQDQLLRIYRIFRRGVREEHTIANLVKPYHQQGTFSVNKTRLNAKLRKQLGKDLGSMYCIKGRKGSTFRIEVDPELVESAIGL